MNTNCLSVRQMAKLLKKITLRENDILLIKKSKFSEEELMTQIKPGVERLKLKTIVAVFVDDFDDLKNYNQQQMNEQGWYHIDQINRLTSQIKK